MMQSLNDLHSTLREAQKGDVKMRHSFVPCTFDNSIFLSDFHIEPKWKRLKAEAEREKARKERGAGVPVDLGLSVLWSSRNVGAASGEQFGIHVGWGDITTRKTSLDYSDYPSVCPPWHICGGENDIASVLWAETWRLPTLQEMIELMQQCQWLWTEINGVQGFQVIGKTGNSIFLPAGGDRYGMQYEDIGICGRYWTGNLYEEETARAYYLEFSQHNAHISTLARYMGMTIRPVLEKE